MPTRDFRLPIEESLYRRLMARAVDLNQSLDSIAQQQLAAWLGEWGLRAAVHVVQPAETLSLLAMRYYGDPAKAAVIAAYNDIKDVNNLRVGQVLRIPEVGPLAPLPDGESPYIFGLHDRGGEYLMGWAGRKGWVLVTERIGSSPDDWASRSYADLADTGFGVLVRLNSGYGEQGTLPRSSRYAAFAARCANFVERSRGCHIWIIGNEMNLAVERPGGPEHGEVITPQMYARAFTMCRNEIRSRPGHSEDQVVIGAVGPWNIQTTYDENPSGDWIVYLQHILEALGGQLDGVAIHTYGRDADPAGIVSEARMEPPFQYRRRMFRTYIDFMEAIPPELCYLPVYITETDQNISWVDVNQGWIQEAYAEIDRWNANPLNQKIRALILYRWEKYAGDVWHIRDKSQIIDDFRAALRHEYRWYR